MKDCFEWELFSGSRDGSKELPGSLGKESGLETFTRYIARPQTLSLTTTRHWILKAKLPLPGDTGVLVCACMFAKEQDGRSEHGGDCRALHQDSNWWRGRSSMTHVLWRLNHHFGLLKSHFPVVCSLLGGVFSCGPAQRQIPLPK